MNTVEKLLSFAKYPAGWHFGQGVPAQDSKVLHGIKIDNALQKKGYLVTDAFLGIDGEIRVTGYWANKYIEITLEADDQISVIFEDELGERQLYVGDSLAEAIDAMEAIEAVAPSWRSPSIRWTRGAGVRPREAGRWLTSGSSISNSLTLIEIHHDSRAWSSSRVGGSPSSMKNVPVPGRTQRANI